MIRVVSYCRVSSEEQAKKDLSIPAQRKAILKYIQDNPDLKLIAEFQDAGVSAYSPAIKRLGFSAMIARAKNKEFDLILVHKLDRFSRQQYEAVVFKSLLRKLGIKIISVTEHFDPDTIEGFLYEGMIQIINQFFSMNLSIETKKGMREASSRGYATGGGTPYGYMRKKIMDNGGRERIVFAPGKPEYIEIAKKIFNAYANTDMGIGAIASMLNRDNIPSPKGSNWVKTSIHNILKNPIYKGTLLWNRRSTIRIEGERIRKDNPPEEWIVIEDAVTPLIEKELFDRCQVKLSKDTFFKKHKETKPRKPHNYILTGMIICGQCGSPYIGKRHIVRGETRYTYICSKYSRGGPAACKHFTISRDWIEKLIVSIIKKYICESAQVDELQKMFEENIETIKKKFFQNRENIIQRRKRIDFEIDKTMEYVRNGGDNKIAIPAIDKLQKEKEKLELESGRLDDDAYYMNQFRANINNLREIISRIDEIFESKPPEERRELIGCFVDKIEVVNHEKLVINLKVQLEEDASMKWFEEYLKSQLGYVGKISIHGKFATVYPAPCTLPLRTLAEKRIEIAIPAYKELVNYSFQYS